MQFIQELWQKVVAWIRNDAAFPQPQEKVHATSEIIEQSRVPKERGSRSKGRKTGKASSRNRVQRKAKRSSKKG